MNEKFHALLNDIIENIEDMTKYSLKKTLEIIVNIPENDFPEDCFASVMVQGDGVVRIGWMIEKNREIRLIIHNENDGESYIYYEVNDEYDIDRNVSVENLVAWFKKMQNL